jgi:hypothetical protein
MTSFITGYITAILTFPGIVVRQIVTQLLCRYFEIPVFKVIYFQPWPPFGAVQHEPPGSPLTGMILILGPCMVNVFLGFLIGFPAVFGFLTFDDTIIVSCRDLFLIWLGISIAVHSFPTFENAKAVKNCTMADRNPSWLQAIGAPLAGLMYLGAIGSIIWLDVIFALIIVIGMPILFFEILRSLN